jgi:YegS/Rv2252/BmrU family lipid kinase
LADVDCYVIANPKAGRGAVGGIWEQLLHGLHGAGLETLGDLTQRPGHAVELARKARADGHTLVVAAGGDGTVHEVVNGLLADGPGENVPVLAIVSAGTGGDFVKTFGLPGDVDGAVARIASAEPPVRIDVGRVTTSDGARFFANIAEAGLGAEVVARAAGMPRRLGASVYLFAFLATLPRFVRPRALVDMDGQTYDGPLTNLVVANGKVFGGGMRVAPGADPCDGALDVQVHWGSKPDYVRGIPKVYRGTHLPHPKIMERRAARVTVRCDPDVRVEADGEVLGTTPATFEVLPAAIRLKV